MIYFFFKNCIAVLRRSCATVRRWPITLTYYFEVAGSRSRRPGGNDGVGVFLRGVCACVVCCVVHEVTLVKLVFRLLHRWFDGFETNILT